MTEQGVKTALIMRVFTMFKMNVDKMQISWGRTRPKRNRGFL